MLAAPASNDPIYQWVFNKVEQDWKVCRKQRGAPARAILVEEFFEEAPQKPKRFWLRDDKGLRQINSILHETYKHHKLDDPNGDVMLFSFRIDKAHDLVVLREDQRNTSVGRQFHYEANGPNLVFKEEAVWTV